MAVYPFHLIQQAAAGLNVAESLSLRPFLNRPNNRLAESHDYKPAPALEAAMNVAIATGRPLLLTGEPGTGKTMAAFFISGRLGLGEPKRFQVRSDSRARDLLYHYDAVGRYHSQSSPKPVDPGSGPERVMDFVTPGALWEAFRGGKCGPVVLLIDEIDKAPRDFPNDLLRELEEYRFTVEEVIPPAEVVCPPEHVPITVITSNSERRLPEPFLRRCIYHHIELDPQLIESIVKGRVGSWEQTHLRTPFLNDALTVVNHIRSVDLLDKRPTVDEFWTWLELFEGDSKQVERDRVSAVAERIRDRAAKALADLPYPGCMVKTIEDRMKLDLA
jgi:MoxR-like ATPase